MQSAINSVLADIRRDLEADKSINRTLTQEQDDSEANVDRFIADLAKEVTDACQMSEDAALDFVLDCCDEAQEMGHLPAMPDEDAVPALFGEWLEKAEISDFARNVVGSAKANYTK